MPVKVRIPTPLRTLTNGVDIAEISGATVGELLAALSAKFEGMDKRLFKNPGHGNDWVNVKLIGVKSNRAAIGARAQSCVNGGMFAAAARERTAAGVHRAALRAGMALAVLAGNPVDLQVTVEPDHRRAQVQVSLPKAGQGALRILRSLRLIFPQIRANRVKGACREATPDISQTRQCLVTRPIEFVPEGRWTGLEIAVHRPFRTMDRLGRCQPLRSWLISAVAPRPNRAIEWLLLQTLRGLR